MFTFPHINIASPHANGLRYCWPMFGHPATLGQEMLQGADAVLTVGASVAGPVPSILTPAYNGTSHGGVAPINLGDVDNLTLAFWLYWDVNTTNDDLCLEYTPLSDSAAGGGGDGFYLDPNAASGFLVGVGGDVGAQAMWFPRATAAAWHHYVILLIRSALAAVRGVPAVYVDGKKQTLTSGDNGDDPTGNFKASSNLYFMSRAGTSLFGPGRICDVRIYAGKQLSAAEAWALYDPRTRWDLYLPAEERQSWPIPVGAGTGPPSGSLALLGVGR